MGNYPNSVSQMGGSTIRVLLVEDDQSVADPIRRHFGHVGVPVTVASTIADAQRVLCTTGVDVLVLKSQLPDGAGETLLPEIDCLRRQPAVLITGTCIHELQPGSLQYRPIAIPEGAAPYPLLRMVRTLARGYSRSIITRFALRFKLSRRETEALVLLSRGLKAKGIASHMGCTDPTAYGHLTRICEKTHSSDTYEVLAKLLAFACQALGHTPLEYPALAEG